jgi:hypothetical protein
LVFLPGILVYIFPFWYIVPSKIWQPCVEPTVAPKVLCVKSNSVLVQS